MKRENGYYWVRANKEEWLIAEWALNSWWISGVEDSYVDNEFVEIDENQIIRK